MTLIRSGKAGWVGSAAPNKPHMDAPRLRVADGVAETFLRMPVPGERGENATVADLSLTVADSDATGAVTFTIRPVSARVPWSNLTDATKPGVTGASVTAVVTDPAAGDVVTFDMPALAQSAIDETHYGWRITSSSAAVTKFYGFNTEDGPTLDLTVTAEPASATDLVPNGVGSLSNPFLQWAAPDLNGGDDQTAFRVQIASTPSPAEDADGTWTAPVYDSGTVTDPSPELDLSATAYAGVAAGVGFYWQVRWQSESGLWAPWSETAHYEREAVTETWTWVNPTAGEVDSTQPTFEATLSGAGTLKAYRLRLALASAPNRVIAGSDKQRTTSQTVSWQPQEMTSFVGDRDLLTLDDGETYIVTVEGWRPQSGGYVASVGDPVQVVDSVTFTVNNASGVVVPVLVSVTEDADLPVAGLSLTCATPPDAFVVYRNGRAVQTVDAADVHVSGVNYYIRHVIANPMREHDYRVRAQIDGAGLSAMSNEISATITPIGVWFVSRDLTLSACLAGPPPSMERRDTAGVFVIQGRDGENQQVVVRSGRGKVDGGFGLVLEPRTGERSTEDQLDDLEAMWAGEEWVHVIAANTSRRVRLLDVSWVPNEDIREGREWVDVSGRIVEVG